MARGCMSTRCLRCPVSSRPKSSSGAIRRRREGTRALTVHYRLIDEAALQRYLAEHAPRMREEGMRRFGDAFTATRRVLAAIARTAQRA